MTNKSVYQMEAKNFLKAELKRRGIDYAQLAELLATIGVETTVWNIRSKMSRGSFSAAFLFQCLNAIGARNIRIDVE